MVRSICSSKASVSVFLEIQRNFRCGIRHWACRGQRILYRCVKRAGPVFGSWEYVSWRQSGRRCFLGFCIQLLLQWISEGGFFYLFFFEWRGLSRNQSAPAWRLRIATRPPGDCDTFVGFRVPPYRPIERTSLSPNRTNMAQLWIAMKPQILGSPARFWPSFLRMKRSSRLPAQLPQGWFTDALRYGFKLSNFPVTIGFRVLFLQIFICIL